MKPYLSRISGRVFAQVLLAGCALAPMTVATAHAGPTSAEPVRAPRAPGLVIDTISQAGSGEYLIGASVSIAALDLSATPNQTGRFDCSAFQLARTRS